MAKVTHPVGSVRVMGDAGSIVPKGSKLSGPGGANYVTLTETTIGASEEESIEVAATKAGDASACSAGTVLKFEKNIEGMEEEAVVGADGIALANGEKTVAPATTEAAPKDDPSAGFSAGPRRRCRVRLVLNGIGYVEPIGELLEVVGGKARARIRLPGGGYQDVTDLPKWNETENPVPSYEMVDDSEL